MSRRCGEPIEVRRRNEVPSEFLWRDRLYVVCAVLAHWVEAAAWWRTAAAEAVLTADAEPPVAADADLDPVLVPVPAAPRRGQRAWSEPALDVGTVATVGDVDDREREFWRVEAGCGRLGGTGVYDLCFDWSAGGWTITRVLD